ncbi:MAG: AAA family ATPase [Bacteroidales bacterium]|nr:AAA family ATPase [Bacteroidales bacterium]
MKVDITSMFFNSKIEGKTATPAWGTSIGQNESRDCRIDDFKPEIVDMVIGMTYKSVTDTSKLDVSKGSNDREILLCSVFDDIYINGVSIKDAQYTLLLVREHSKSHDRRLIISYAPYISFNGIPNQVCIDRMQDAIGCKQEGCWFVYEISIRNQSELHFKAVVVNADKPMVYSGSTTSKQRSDEWKSLIPEGELHEVSSTEITESIIPYLTALRTKPFMLLAGISGTGKSRIVREMAKACWKEGDEEYGKNNPRNFCMVQVKPNWHDSTELMGYVTRISGTPEYIPGPFLRFLAATIKEPSVPYFLCLDEMNLAPVEQYFAEYLSVIESRKLNSDGTITTDPIIKPEDTQEYHDLIGKLLGDEERLKGTTLTIPQNFFVVGTVNMDETTFSFSRKVLDRAMTIEMNEVDLHGGLAKMDGNEIGYIGNSIIGTAAEGCDIYEDNRELCDQVLAYLEEVNKVLEGTPFKIAYRTRNEFLMYAVNRQQLAPESQLWQTLDEMTSMKILSRIEGDSDRTEKPLTELKKLVDEHIVNAIPTPEDGSPKPTSITATKIDEMLKKLDSGFTSYWT